MHLLNCCLGRGTDKPNQSLMKSYDGRDRLLLKGNKILQFNINNFNTHDKKNEPVSFSPFRRRSELVQLNTFQTNNYVNPVVKSNNINKKIEVSENEKENIKNRVSLKRLVSKQRFSTMSQKNLEHLSQANKDIAEEEKIKNKNTHWEKKDKFKCLFCRGEKCKHENYQRNKNSVIQGLHSDYITEDIIASQRPSTVLIKKHNLVSVFKSMNIGLIVNVQREGEHPYCGPNGKLEESGFSYNPHQFLSGDVKCKISGWKDMSVPQSVNFMLDIVKDMSIMIKEKLKKVLVHCHAGYGRTGVVIACYLIYNSSKSVSDVVNSIRIKRSECIQKREQFSFCEKFADFIYKARILFDLSGQENHNKRTIEYFIKHQKDILFGYECEKFEHVPKLIYKILERLIEVKNKFIIDLKCFCNFLSVFEEWNQEHEQVLSVLKYDSLIECDNLEILATLLYDWLEDDVEFIISPEKVNDIIKDSSFMENAIYNVENASNHYIIQKNKESRKVLFDFLKSQLLNVEYGTLTAVAQFFESIYPNNEEDLEFFIDTIDRFCVHLMGYKYSEAYNSKNNRTILKITTQVTGLCNIIRLLIIGIKFDFGDHSYLTSIKNVAMNKQFDNSFSQINKSLIRSNSTKNINSKNRFTNLDVLFDNPVIELNNGRVQPAGDLESVFSNISFINDMKTTSSDQQDQFLHKVYETLKNFYDGKESHEIVNFNNVNNSLDDNDEDSNNASRISKFNMNYKDSSKLALGNPSNLNIPNITNHEQAGVFIEFIKDFYDKNNLKSVDNNISPESRKKEFKRNRFSMIYTPSEVINESNEEKNIYDSMLKSSNEMSEREEKRVVSFVKGLINNSPIKNQTYNDDKKKVKYNSQKEIIKKIKFQSEKQIIPIVKSDIKRKQSETKRSSLFSHTFGKKTSSEFSDDAINVNSPRKVNSTRNIIDNRLGNLCINNSSRFKKKESIAFYSNSSSFSSERDASIVMDDIPTQEKIIYLHPNDISSESTLK